MNKRVFVVPLIILGCLSCNKKDVYYKIKWSNYDGTILKEEDVLNNTLPTFALEDPKKPDDENYAFKFEGWDPEVVPATKDTTYTAKYRSVERCNLKFLDFDGTELNTISSNLEDKDQTEYVGKVPYKPNEGEKYFYFTGWEESKNSIKEFVFTPKFNECKKDDDQDNDGMPDYLDPYPTNNEITVSMSFMYKKDLPSTTIKDAKFKMDYINMFVSDDAKTDVYNKDIAVLGSIINDDNSVTGYGEVKENGNIKSRDSYTNIFKMLGCDEVKMLEGKKTYSIDRDDYASIVAAHKSVKYKNENRDFLFLVAEQNYKESTGSGWKSNFDVGCNSNEYFSKEGSKHDQNWLNNTEYHKGFYVSTKRLYEDKVKSYLNQYNNPVVFLTGHSRGGAVANIMGNILNQQSKAMKLFVYTYASPNTYFGEKADENNKNIFNIINGDDFVPSFPFSSWNDGNAYAMKFGTDVELFLSDYKEEFKARTSQDYAFVVDGKKTIVDGMKMSREDIYKVKDSGSSEHYNSQEEAQAAIDNYKLMLKNSKVSDSDIKNYFDFKIEKGLLSYNLIPYNSVVGGFKIGFGLLDDGEVPDVDMLVSLFNNYKWLGVDLYLQGLNVESVALPHYLTSYYLISSIIS